MIANYLKPHSSGPLDDENRDYDDESQYRTSRKMQSAIKKAPRTGGSPTSSLEGPFGKTCNLTTTKHAVPRSHQD